ncbi:MAG: thiamine pyrophosphate-dependent dehydrogenase E1 component subunit alpha [Firmicutes bacterium]|nr:thiamine pyrophosphate-dependent dehydrogenase E1 component subunit alpha [Bacillota bacterium]
MLRKMLRIREFEELADQLFAQKKVQGTTHLYVGEEAVAVGACAAIGPTDLITSTHRGHGHCIAKGADLRKMMAELLGKATGYCKGKGGSLHIADVPSGNLGANGIVGGGIALAVGAALSSHMRRSGQVVLCFFGDGAANQGVFHESLNLAAIWKLPVVFICENNAYAMSTPVAKAFCVNDIAVRAVSYGMPGETVDGNDVIAVFKAVSRAVERARGGGGPSLVECKTYRWKGHSKGDARKYRTREEEQQWRERCPIKRFLDVLTACGIVTEQQAAAEREKARRELEDALDFAHESPFPDPSEVATDVYC